MTNSEFAVWLSNIYAARSAVVATKALADADRRLRVAANLADAAESITQAIEAAQEQPTLSGCVPASHGEEKL